jgi:hypothetical protein
MRRSPLLLLPLLALLGAADPPEPASSAAPDASAAASVAPWSPPSAPWIPPEERSAKPRLDEWATAEPLALPRPHADCRAARLREWVRVSCAHQSDEYMGVRIVGGSHEDVTLEAAEPDPAGKKLAHHVGVVFPVRRGDRRLLEIPISVSAGFKSYSIEEQAVAIISSLWLPGDPAPTLVIH